MFHQPKKLGRFESVAAATLKAPSVCSQDSFFTIQVAVSSRHSANPCCFENIRCEVPPLLLESRKWYHVLVTNDKRKAEKLRNQNPKNLPAEVIICSAVFEIDRLGSIHERLVETSKKKGGDTKENIIHGSGRRKRYRVISRSQDIDTVISIVPELEALL
ncbi:hypothetical protein EDB85DRAFT_982435 [Lactarius pseudohatsudake]|nr:hypothetical protein EDB85DRAFT_982435 [Lactarius pseudohatsudake]